MRTEVEIDEEVRSEMNRLARERYDSIQINHQTFVGDWPFSPGDYPWLAALAEVAIAHGLAAEVAGKPCHCGVPGIRATGVRV